MWFGCFLPKEVKEKMTKIIETIILVSCSFGTGIMVAAHLVRRQINGIPYTERYDGSRDYVVDINPACNRVTPSLAQAAHNSGLFC